MEFGQAVAGVIGALGGLTGLAFVFRAIHRWWSGRAQRDELLDALAYGDTQAKYRRMAVEALHLTRVKALEYGVPFEELPPMPRFGSDTGSIDTKDKKND